MCCYYAVSEESGQVVGYCEALPKWEDVGKQAGVDGSFGFSGM